MARVGSSSQPIISDAGSIDTLVFQRQRANKSYNMLKWHSVAQHTTDKLSIVPEFRIECTGQAFHQHFITVFIIVLEIVGFCTILVTILDDET